MRKWQGECRVSKRGRTTGSERLGEWWGEGEGIEEKEGRLRKRGGAKSEEMRTLYK